MPAVPAVLYKGFDSGNFVRSAGTIYVLIHQVPTEVRKDWKQGIAKWRPQKRDLKYNSLQREDAGFPAQ